MNSIVTKAIEALSKLPEPEQEAIARDLLDRIEGDARWDALLADPRSDDVLAQLASEAKNDIKAGRTIQSDPATRRRS